MLTTILQKLLSYRWWWFLCACTLAAVAYLPASQVTYNRSIENMFAAGDPIVEPYRRLKRVFGGNELVLAVYDDPELLAADGQGIRRLAEIRRRLEEISGVREVLSLDRPLGEVVVDPDNDVAARMRETMSGYTHGSDGRTVAAVCMLAPVEEQPQGHAATITAIRAVMNDLPDGLEPGLIGGEPVLVEEGFAALEIDGRRLAIWSTIFVGFTILLCFRSLRWVLIPLLIVQWTLVITAAILAITGLRLSLVSSMWASILTVVGIATAVHLLVQYRDLRREGQSAEAALLKASLLVAMPIVWSLVTDACGFGSLLISGVGPVRDFGLMTAVGSLLVLVGLITITPTLALVGRWDDSPTTAWGEGQLNGALTRLTHWVERYPRTIVTLLVAVLVLALVGMRNVDVETDFTKNFRAGSPLVRSYEFIETRLGGAGVLDVLLPSKESLDWEYLQRVLRLEERLRREISVTNEHGETEPGLTKVLSAADALVAAAPKHPATIKLELLRRPMLNAAWSMMKQRSPVFSAALHSPDPADPERWWYRILIRAKERQTAAEKLRIISDVRRIVAEEWPTVDDQPADQQAVVTGYFVLLTNMIASTVSDQWVSFGWATLGVAVVLLLAFRRPSWVVIALVPNALPILLVLGLLGWLHLKMNLGVAMIAAVSMGLSVDSSIHYLTAYRRQRQTGDTTAQALAHVQQSVGRAMVFSTLALIVGFTVLSSSEFVPTIYFGWLVSLAMLGGLAGNLVILPLLLHWFDRS
ncbi:MAG: efflux RND transporter permease subunit [Planctomycetota bacterium]